MDQSPPLGVVLAGGQGRRMGAAKAMVQLCGRPLISYPLAALGRALGEVVVLAKPTTALPSLPGTEVWIEHEARQHPLVGLLEALALAGGRAVVVCALDLPLVTPELVRRLVSSPPARARVASHRGQLQPLLGCYRAEALEPLRAAAPAVALRAAVAALRPELLEVDPGELLLNVNTPADLERAAALISRRSRTSCAPAE